MSLDDRDWWREDRRRKEKHQVENIEALWSELEGRNRRQQGGYRGQRSGKGCGPLLATVICVVLLALTVATYDPEPRHETSGYESRSESIDQSEETRPGIEFRREVPYREIDLTQSVVERDSGVSDASVQKVEEMLDFILSTEALKRQFYGNGWTVYITDHALPMQGAIQPAGMTDTSARRISLVEEHIDRAVYHEFGHYFMAMYVFNVPGAQAELEKLYAEEAGTFQSHTGIAEDTMYGMSALDEFIASVFDNIVHDFTGCCPKTEAYVQNMYGTLMQMDYADVFSTDYEYHHSFEEMLLKYGASYEFYIDGQRIDPASYDVHDLRAQGYESTVTDYGGYGSVNVTTY